MFCVIIILISLGAWGNGSVSAQNRRPKNVQVAVRAKWLGTPLLLEAGYVVSFYVLIYLLVLFFLNIFHCLSVKLVSCKCLLNLEMVFAFYLAAIFL